MSPLILITGIFDAGKTAFLRNLLPVVRAAGWHPHVLLNHHDQEIASRDATSLAEVTSTRVLPFAGGCLCCDVLDAFLNAVAATPTSEKSLLIVEASAIAEPNNLLESLALDPRAARFGPPVQINIVDAMRWQRRNPPVLNRLEGVQLITAPYLVINRLGDLKKARRQKVESSVASLNPYAHLVASADAIPPILADLVSPSPNPQHFSTLKIPLRSKVDRQHLSAFLNSLPREVIRAKGTVQLTDHDTPVLFEKIDGEKSIHFHDLEKSAAAQITPLLLIVGPNLPADLLENSAHAQNLTG